MDEQIVRLRTEALSCGYGPRVVLSDLTFEVNAGEIVALLGPNGSGKSTLLKTLAHTLRPLSGRALIEGRELRSLGHAQLAQRLSYVPQEEDVRFPFTAYEMVAMGRLARSGSLFDTPEDREASQEAMIQTDSWDLAHRPITELSGGERQRVLVARALAQGARVLLLDEPTAHLDVRHVVEFCALMTKLAGQGFAVLTAIHDLTLAGRIADRGLLLHDGGILADLPMESILESPLLDRAYDVRFHRHLGMLGTLLEAS